MNNINTKEFTGNVSRKENARSRITQLRNHGLFPDNMIKESNNLIVNLCLEERWSVNNPEESNSELIEENTEKSIKKIDKVLNLIDDSLGFNHIWSVTVTYIDLVKEYSEGVIIRLRYEIEGKVLTVKWLVIDKSNGDDTVYVSIAKNSIQISEWERHFLSLSSIGGKVLFRHQKYFFLNAEGVPLDDYIVNDMDGNRTEVTIESDEDMGLLVPQDFIGVFIQDRYRLPLDGIDPEGLIGYKEIMELIKNELLANEDQIGVLKKYGLFNKGVRLELESYKEGSEKDNKVFDSKLDEYKSQIEAAINSGNLAQVTQKL